MDEVIIYLNSVKHHIHRFDEILTKIAETGVTLKMKKCKLFSD